jgi:hypothetical protein
MATNNGHQETRAAAELPDIVISPDAAAVVDAAVSALENDEGLYQRGGFLSRVIRDTSPAAGEDGVRRPFSPRIDRLPRATLLERLTTVANWWKEGSKGKLKRALPPEWCVNAVDARGEWTGIRHLEGVTEYPVLRPDGTLLVTSGYDRATGLLFEANGVHGRLKESPRLADARKAVCDLLDVAGDFPFLDDVHRAAWLAALLTPLARFAFAGPAPLFLADSNVRAAGKGLLLDCIARVITGQRFTVATYTRDEDELRKRITSLALAGERLVLFDNLAGGFGGPILDAALTASSWSDRLLGGNRTTSLPLYATWYATGNNVGVAGDTARRVCHIRLESPEEKPERRNDFKRPRLLAWVGANRGKLLAAALTVLRGYCVDGRPDLGLPAWGSFEGWSSLVRQAVVWAGQPDPGDTRLLLEESADTTAECMAVLLECWERMDPGRKGLLAAQVIHELYKGPPAPVPDWHAEMKDALESLVGKPDARGLGFKLRSYRRRVFGALYLDHAGSCQRAIRWAVYPAGDFRQRVLGRRAREPGEEG